MDNNVILYGASGHGKVIVDILKCNQDQVLYILDDNPKEPSIMDVEIKNAGALDFKMVHNLIISIGNNRIRKELSLKFDCIFFTAVHPKATIASSSKLGAGTVVMAGAVINAGAKIGTHCIINTGTIIEHDCVLENYVHVSPAVALAGGIKIGEGTHVGINATVIQNVHIGKWVTVGAGAVVLEDVPDFAVVVGNPAKIIKYNYQHE